MLWWDIISIPFIYTNQSKNIYTSVFKDSTHNSEFKVSDFGALNGSQNTH